MKCNSLEEVRENIDSIDDKIIKLIAERSDYVRQAAYFKKSKTDVKAADRVEKIIKKVREKAKIYGCSPDVVELIYRDMINYFISEEMKTLIQKDVVDYSGEMKLIMSQMNEQQQELSLLYARKINKLNDKQIKKMRRFLNGEE